MPDKLVVELATEIASKTIQDNIFFYVVSILLIFLAGAGIAFLGAYWKKRGETYATSADFKKILEQLQKTTEATETIKLELQAQFSDDAAKKALFREKLEEFVAATYELSIWIQKVRIQAINDKADIEFTTSPINKIETFQKIYFREVENEVDLVVKKNLEIQIWLRTLQIEIIQAKNESRTPDTLKSSENAEYLMPFFDALNSLRNKIIEIYADRAGL